MKSLDKLILVASQQSKGYLVALAYWVQGTSSPSQSPAAAQSAGPKGATVNQTAPASQLHGSMRFEIGGSRLHAEALSLSLYLSHLFCSESFCHPLISFQPVQWVSCQIHRLKVANITLLVPLVTKLCFHKKNSVCPLLPAFDTRPKCQKVCGTACPISLL